MNFMGVRKPDPGGSKKQGGGSKKQGGWSQKQGHAACNGPAVFSPLHSLIFVCRMTLTAFSWSAHLLSS